jgi:hypothetical protein
MKPIDPEEPEGWTWLLDGSWHYFRHGESLCRRRYQLMAAEGDLQSNRPPQEGCLECVRNSRRPNGSAK